MKDSFKTHYKITLVFDFATLKMMIFSGLDVDNVTYFYPGRNIFQRDLSEHLGGCDIVVRTEVVGR